MGFLCADSRGLCHRQVSWMQQQQQQGFRMDTVILVRLPKSRRWACPAVAASCQKPSWNNGIAHSAQWKDAGLLVAAVLTFSVSLSPSALALEAAPQAQLTIMQQDAGCRKEPAVAVSMPFAPAAASVQQAIPVLQPAVARASTSRFLAKLLQHFGGGGIAGAIGAALVYPLDTIKTRMQAQSTIDGEQPDYKDEIDCFKKLVAHEGMGSLYSGLIPQLVGVAPEKAMKLTVNELFLELLEHMMPGAWIWALELIAGSAGGFSQVLFTNPVEVVKVRLQTQKASKGLWGVLSELGFQGLYAGVGATMARDIPSSGLFFACYAFLKQLYPDQSFADGFLAAIPATLVSNPMDVVKTRLQMELPEGEAPHKNGLDCLRKLYLREGPKALFKGSLARVLRTSPQFGITFLLYSLMCS